MDDELCHDGWISSIDDEMGDDGCILVSLNKDHLQVSKKKPGLELLIVMQNTCSRSDSCFKQVMSSRVVCSSTMPSSTLTIFVKENKESLRIFWFYSFFPKWNLQSKMNYSTPKCWTFHGTMVLWFMINSNKHILEISSKSIVQLAHFDLWSMVTNTSLIAMSGFK